MNKFKKSFAIISAAMMIASVSACSASTTSGSGSDLAMAGVNGEYLRNAFDKVKEKYGSVDDYIRNRLSVSDEEREQLKNMYLE